MNVSIEDICKEAFQNKIEELSGLLKLEINLNYDGKCGTPLQHAIEGESIDCIKLLINKGADVNFRGFNVNLMPLAHAIDISIQSNNNFGGNSGDESVEIINILLSAGANPREGLEIATLYRSGKILSILQNYITDSKS